VGSHTTVGPARLLQRRAGSDVSMRVQLVLLEERAKEKPKLFSCDRATVWGVRTFCWTRSCCQADALPVDFGALSPEGHLDTFFVVPSEIAVKFIDKPGYRDVCP